MVATTSRKKRSTRIQPRNGDQEGQIVQIPIDQISPSPFQPREYFDEEKLQEMAVTIKQRGRLIQPVTVRRLRGQNRFELVLGERRWRAAKLAGLSTVSAVIRDLSDEQAAEESSIENLQREDLTPAEEGRAIKRLLDLGFSLETVSERIGKSPAYLQARLDVLDLPQDVQQMIGEEKINLAHAEVLRDLPTKKDQREAAKMAHQQRLTAVQLKARTQHKRKPKGERSVTHQVYGHQQLSKDILSLHANLQALQIDPELPDQKRQTLAKQIGVLIKALEKAQRGMIGRRR